MGTQQFAELYPVVGISGFVAADGTTAKAPQGPGPVPSRYDAIYAANSGAGGYNVAIGWLQMSLTGAATFAPVCEFTVPAGAGQGLTPPFDVVAALPTALQTVLFSLGFRPLAFNVPGSVGGADQVTIFCIGGAL